MKEYKRLTTKGSNYYDDREVTCAEEIYEQLKDLEDKIENGTLIELPCKVGDTIFWISSNNRDIIEVVVKRIAFAEHDRTILYVEEKGFGEYTIMFVDDIYKTKAEAEAKLKELKEV